MNSEYIVVSDLDGTLLDHHTYEWRAAAQALATLASRKIPLVLCSSKTAAEIMPLRQALKNCDPFIVENGAAIYLPPEKNEDTGMEIISFGMNRAEILEVLSRIRQAEPFAFTGFSDMTVSDLTGVTGLDDAGANHALQREFTEPLLWQDSEESKTRFIKRLKKAGLDAIQGGRFLHVSAGCDKGRAMHWLRQYYEKTGDTQYTVIALGDSENDISMLENADLPVLVKSPVKPFPEIRHEHVYRTKETGPAGWNEALLEILK